MILVSFHEYFLKISKRIEIEITHFSIRYFIRVLRLDSKEWPDESVESERYEDAGSKSDAADLRPVGAVRLEPV